MLTHCITHFLYIYLCTWQYTRGETSTPFIQLCFLAVNTSWVLSFVLHLVLHPHFAFFMPLCPYLHYWSHLYYIVAFSSYSLAHHIPNSSEGIYRTVGYSSHLFRYRLWCCCVVFDHIATASVSFWSPPRGDCLQSPSGLPLTIPTKFFKLFAPPHGLCDDRVATYQLQAPNTWQ